MKQLKKILSVLLVLAMIVAYVPPITASAEEQTHTITFDNKNKRTEFTTKIQVWEENGITVTNNKSASTSNVADYANPARFYASSNLVIEMPGMTKIVFDANNGTYATAIKNSIGTTATATVSSDKVTVTFNEAVDSFTISKLTAQVRMDSITVTVLVGGGDEDVTKFNVTFDLNYEGAPAPTTMQIVDGESYGKLPVVARKAYTFDGWCKTADGSGAVVTAEDTVTEEHTLYAKWTPKPVAAVSFDLNGAEDTAPEAITVVIGDAYETLPMASREGYVFGGWYTDSGCTGTAVKVTDVVEATHTLYAKWIKGNTIQIAISFNNTTQRISYSTSKHVWGNEGLTFTNDKASSTTNIANYPDDQYAHIRLYKDSKVTIACEGMTKMVIVSESGSDYKTAFTNSLISAGLNYTLSGDTYTILFSELTDSVTIPMSGGQARMKSITVTALEPAPAVFDVSFDLNGAEGTAPEAIQVEEGKAYGELPEVSREGYTFDGWYKTADCSGEAVTAEDTVSEEHILYAKWTYIPTEDSSDIVENWGLTLKDEVVVKFNMTFTPETLADAGAYVEVKVDDEITKIAVADVAGPLEIPVSAAQMTDEITLCVVKGNENRGEEMVFTVRQYCETILADEKYAAYHPLVKEMLNYGGYAQAYFGHNTDNMANEGLKDVGLQDISADAAPEKVVSGEIEGISYYGASLLLRDKVALRFYFTVTGDIAEYTFKVNGKEVNWGKKNGMYYIDASDIPAWDLATPVTVTVNDTLTITNSPMNYIVGMSNNSTPGLSALVKALYNYHLAAKAFMAQG